MASNSSGRLICLLNYSEDGIFAVPRTHAVLTHCRFEHPACPSSIIGRALGLTIVKNKSSWLAAYTMVWGSRNNSGDSFWESLAVSYLWVEKRAENGRYRLVLKLFLKLLPTCDRLQKPIWENILRRICTSSSNISRISSITPDLSKVLKSVVLTLSICNSLTPASRSFRLGHKYKMFQPVFGL